MYKKFFLVVFLQFLIGLTDSALHVYNDLYEGSDCMLENGDAGICKKLLDCPYRLEEVREGRRNSGSFGRCGFDNFTEIVCCSVNITDKIGLRAADVACQQYENEIMAETVKSNDLVFHIFGGIEAQSGEFPYMVALGYEKGDDDDEESPPIRYSCGGTLISSRYVLTAAHCVNNINRKVPVEVRLGSEDMRSTSANVKRIPISDIICHPKYKRTTNYNDVAILKLRDEVQISVTTKPICLQTKSLSNIGEMTNSSLVVIGWGSTSFENERSVKLMRTPSLSVVDKETCAKSYTGFLKLPRGLDENMICAVDTNTTRGADACQGDSGGPLLMLSETGDSIIGITAFGQTCGGSIPGVYTAVHPYLDWIEEQVWPSDDVLKI